jgi:hypothetical protein
LRQYNATEVVVDESIDLMSETTLLEEEEDGEKEKENEEDILGNSENDDVNDGDRSDNEIVSVADETPLPFPTSSTLILQSVESGVVKAGAQAETNTEAEAKVSTLPAASTASIASSLVEDVSQSSLSSSFVAVNDLEGKESNLLLVESAVVEAGAQAETEIGTETETATETEAKAPTVPSMLEDASPSISSSFEAVKNELEGKELEEE